MQVEIRGKLTLIRKNGYHKFVATAATAAMVTSALLPNGSVLAQAEFKDLKNTDFGNKEILALHQNGVIDGFPDGTFRGSQSLKREEATKLIMAGLNKQGDSKLPTFSDVKADSVWMPYVDAALDHGVMFGHRDGKFGFGDYLTRQQMASILVRAFELKPVGKTVDFKDMKDASVSHQQDIQVLAQNGITFGFSDGTFRPNEVIDRATFSVFLYRALEKIGAFSGVQSIKGNSLVYKGQTYTFSDKYAGIFKSDNLAALKHANLTFTAKSGKIESVQSISITTSEDLSLHLGNQSFDGAISMSGKSITLYSGSVVGDVSLKSRTNIKLSDLKVQNNLKLDGKISSLTNSSIGKLSLQSKDGELTVDTQSSISEMYLTENATITWPSNKISKLIIGPNATNITYNGGVQTLVIDGKGKVAINGLLSLGNIQVADGLNVQDVITNYAALQQLMTPPVFGGGVVPPVSPGNVIDLSKPQTIQDDTILNGNYTLEFGQSSAAAPTLFGASSKGKEIRFNGDVLVKGNGYIDLSHVIISGKLTLDPGDMGGAHLQNVKANSIEVKTGAMNSTVFEDVQADLITVTDANGGRIMMEGSNSVNQFVLNPASSNQPVPFILGGTFVSPINVNSSVSLQTDSQNPLSAEQLNIAPNQANSVIEIDGDLTGVKNVVVSSPVAIELSPLGTVSSIEVQSDISLNGDFSSTNMNVTAPSTMQVNANTILGTVNVNSNLTLTGDLSNSVETLNLVVEEQGQVEVLIEDSTKEDIKNEAIKDANLLIAELLEHEVFAVEHLQLISNIDSLLSSAKLFGAVDADIKQLVEYLELTADYRQMLEKVEKLKSAIRALPSSSSSKTEVYIIGLKDKVAKIQQSLSDIQQLDSRLANLTLSELTSVELAEKFAATTSFIQLVEQEWTMKKERIIELVANESLTPEQLSELKELLIAYKAYELTDSAELIAEVEALIMMTENLTAINAEIDSLLGTLTKENHVAFSNKAEEIMNKITQAKESYGDQWSASWIPQYDAFVAEYHLALLYSFEESLNEFIALDPNVEFHGDAYSSLMTSLTHMLTTKVQDEPFNEENSAYLDAMLTSLDRHLIEIFHFEFIEDDNGNFLLPTEGRYGISISWTSSHPEIVSNEGVVNRDNLENTPVEVTMTATITSNNETGIKDYNVMISPDTQNQNDFGSLTFEEWKTSSENFGYIDSFIHFQMDLNKITDEYPQYHEANISLSIDGQEEELIDLHKVEYDGLRFARFWNSLSYFGLHGNQKAKLHIQYLDYKEQVLGTKDLELTIVELRDEIVQAFEAEKHTLDTSSVTSYLIDPHLYSTEDKKRIVNEFQNLESDLQTIDKLHELSQMIKDEVDSLGLVSGVPLVLSGYAAGPDNEYGLINNVTSDNEDVQITENTNEYGQKEFLVDMHQVEEAVLTIELESGKSFKVPVENAGTLSTMDMIHAALDNQIQNNQFSYIYKEKLLKYAVSNETSLSVDEEVLNHLNFLGNLPVIDNIRFYSLEEVQTALDQLAIEIKPLIALSKDAQELRNVELKKGESFSIWNFLAEGEFAPYLSDEDVELEMFSTTYPGLPEGITFEDGIIHISEDYDGSMGILYFDFFLTSGEMVRTQQWFEMLTTPRDENNFTMHLPYTEGLTYMDDLELEVPFPGKGYVLKKDLFTYDFNDEYLKEYAQDSFDLEQGIFNPSISNYDEGDYVLVIKGENQKSVQNFTIKTENSLEPHEYTINETTDTVSFVYYSSAQIHDLEFDLTSLGTLANKEFNAEDFHIEFGAYEGGDPYRESLISQVLSEGDYEINGNILTFHGVEEKFNEIAKDFTNPLMGLTFHINGTKKEMWKLEEAGSPKAIKMKMDRSFSNWRTNYIYYAQYRLVQPVPVD